MSELEPGTTIAAARRAVTARLRTHHIDTPELDARILIGAVTDLTLTGLVASSDRLLTDHELARINALVWRRLRGEPVARLLGVKEFWGLPFRLVEATLVPRPDTETIVEAALEAVQDRRLEPLRIADLGTGSGAILLALLSELPHAFGVGTDISEAALRAARDNAERLGLLHRAGFAACDYASALGESFDLIVSNPPYIASAEIGALATEVRVHDPLRALDGGPDGLDAYRALIPQAARLLRPGTPLVVEIGFDQADAVSALMADAGLLDVSIRYDLGGQTRAVSARKPQTGR